MRGGRGVSAIRAPVAWICLRSCLPLVLLHTVTHAGSDVSDFSSEARVSDPLATMRALVRGATSADECGGSIKARIALAATRLRITATRARAHWYGEARAVPAAEWIAAVEAARNLRQARAARLRAELAQLEALDALDAAAASGCAALARGSRA